MKPTEDEGHLPLNLEPDLRLAGLSLWITGRQFPENDDYWDGNWLNVQARVEANGALVQVSGPILHLSEIASFANELELLDRTLAGSASLNCTEPNLGIDIVGNSRGQATATIRLTPDHMTQTHEFIFEIDQTYFGFVLAACKRILSEYAIRMASP